jgi:ubiquinone/menaquinone biosynthesis C-methylase UbiE
VQESPEEVRGRIADLFGRVAPTYDTVIPFFETFARHLVRAARLKAGERVLDIACGRGACARNAAETVGPGGYVLGLDLSAGMVAEAQKDLAELNIHNAEFQVGAAEHLDLPDTSFDTVLCGFGVFFFAEPTAALLECQRVLRSSGRFAASTFLDGVGGYKWEDEVLKEIGRGDPVSKSPTPLRTAGGLVAAVARAGFTAPRITRVEGRFVFSDVNAYLAWNWSHSGRRLLESLSGDELARFAEGCAARLAAHAVSGGYEFIQIAELTVAARP